ncbi:L-aspartate oxidase [Gordonia soli]|uniref:L-aspartate oxidase n=1 Tax=Gordonia soli NBRC 108243 TaxID=1223545 RepID=M0QEL0_9ACTN|nr:L-aspartate oxidase [Gordonia soli]GAC67038.1 L-aspartate oxidase [Gordonia soli NBRC 108243]
MNDGVMDDVTRADLVVVGAGVAGLTAAIRAAELGLSVVILNKGPQWDAHRVEQSTSTFYAQGGIAVVDPRSDTDTVADHLDDTVAAGAGLTVPDAAASILAGGWSAVATLIDWGARFDRDADGRLLRTLEGGHHARRVIHAGGDATGAEVARTLGRRLGTAVRDLGVVCVDDAVVTSILLADGRAAGVAYRTGGRTAAVTAPSVLLATGGVGHLYVATTNPAGATGDGIALALRAGADVADLEFIQFHPTMLHVPGARGRRMLITEAVRGEGGRLIAVDGRSVTDGVHPLGDLAPRDIVADAVTDAMARTGHPCVYLDVSAVDDFARRFPTVAAGVTALGAATPDGRIPVVPGAHYLCGGVRTDAFGATTVPGLLAAGEVARTGLHGANRLASNSLLEGLVVGCRVADHAAAHRRDGISTTVGVPVHGHRDVGRPMMARAELQDLMTALVALRRDGEGLAAAARRLDAAPRRVADGPSALEDVNLTLGARAVVAAAADRDESRGSHTRIDHPRTESVGSSTTYRLIDDEIVGVGVESPVTQEVLAVS